MDLQEIIGKIDSISVDLKGLLNIAMDYANMHDGIEEIDNLYVLLGKMEESVNDLCEIAQEDLPNAIKI